MADVIRRTWTSGPRKVKRTSWGFTYQDASGHQVRKFDATWTADDARAALVVHQKTLAAPPQEPGPPAAPAMTWAEACARYLQRKSRKKTVVTDQTYLDAFTAFFGAETPLKEITAKRISAWRDQRLAARSPHSGQLYSAAGVNRPLAT